MCLGLVETSGDHDHVFLATHAPATFALVAVPFELPRSRVSLSN